MSQTQSDLSARFTQAFVYAQQLHGQQFRKGGSIPYLSHLMSVAALVLEDNGTEEDAIAALLHDAVEDQGGHKTLEEIRVQFGDTIAGYVDALSDARETPKPPWRQRKLQYFQQLREAPSPVLHIAIADKLHNARSIVLDSEGCGARIWERFKTGKSGTIWYYRTFIQLCQEQGCTSRHLPELSQLVNRLKAIPEASAGE